MLCRAILLVLVQIYTNYESFWSFDVMLPREAGDYQLFRDAIAFKPNLPFLINITYQSYRWITNFCFLLKLSDLISTIYIPVFSLLILISCWSLCNILVLPKNHSGYKYSIFYRLGNLCHTYYKNQCCNIKTSSQHRLAMIYAWYKIR